MRVVRGLQVASLSLALLSVTVIAKEAAPLAQDPALEKKVMDISRELRCLVCQNQTIADSDAELAHDLRREVGEMVQKGMNQDQIVAFMEQRYGDFVRYRPAFKLSTLFLWLGPLLLFAVALSVLYRNVLRKRKTVDDTQPLSEEEQKRLAALMAQADGAGEKKL